MMGALFQAHCKSCEGKHDFFVPDIDATDDSEYEGVCPTTGKAITVSTSEWNKVVDVCPRGTVLVRQCR